jgi:RNA polymerase sigma-70 factor (ECF subfamily)
MSERVIQFESNPDRTAEFLRLFSANQPRLFAYILALVPKWHDAEEILQQTSVVLWQSFGQFRPGTDFRAWASKTAFHQVLSFRKRQKRLAVPLSEQFVEAVAEECDNLSDDLEEQLQTLAECVEKLAPDERELISACYEPDAVTKQVAARLGQPAGTVYKSLTRIRRALLRCIEQSLAEGGHR